MARMGYFGKTGKQALRGEPATALPCHFGRQPFAMASLDGAELGVNSYLDMIYRLPIRQSETNSTF
jgi:hypothetical protein